MLIILNSLFRSEKDSFSIDNFGFLTSEVWCHISLQLEYSNIHMELLSVSHVSLSTNTQTSPIERTDLYSVVVSAIQVNDSRFLESGKQWAGYISRLGQGFKLTI